MQNFKNELITSKKIIGLTLPIPIPVLIFTVIGNNNLISFLIQITILSLWFLLVFRYRGVQIDFFNQKVRSYSTLFYFKIGQLRDLHEFPYYRIKRFKKPNNYSSRGGEGSYEIKKKGVYIYDKKNKQEILITSTTADMFLEKLAYSLEKVGIQKK